MAACVTIVRAALDAASVKLRVNMPTAATSPVVVCANLRIANEPVTCGTDATLPWSVVVVAVVDAAVVVDDVVGGSTAGVVGDCEGVVGGFVVAEVDDSVGVADGSVGVVGSTGVVVVETFVVPSVPVTGMISLPGAD
jgi:hypothetical protein